MSTVLMVNTKWMEDFLLPVFVCVVLPCVIVWITIKEKIFGRLTTGCILAALGIALFGVALFGKEAVTDSFYVPHPAGSSLSKKVQLFGNSIFPCLTTGHQLVSNWDIQSQKSLLSLL